MGDKIRAKRGDIDLVLTTTSDLATKLGHQLRSHLGVAPARWEISDPNLFYDKYSMKRQLVFADSEIKTSEFIAFDAPRKDIMALAKSIGFPKKNALILKKRRSASGIGITVIKTRKELEEQFKKVKNKSKYLIERFVVGKNIRINGEIEKGEIKIFIPAIHRTSPLEHYQYAKMRITTNITEDMIDHARLRDFTERTLKALMMTTGTYHLEGIYGDDGHIY